MTQLAEQLKAKMPTAVASTQLATLAFTALRQAGGDAAAARDRFAEAVSRDATLLVALFGGEAVRARAHQYLQQRLADMAPASRPATEMDGGRGQCIYDNQSRGAPSPSTPLPGEGHDSRDNQKKFVRPRQAQSDERGPGVPDDQRTCAPSSPAAGGGHKRYENQTCPAPAGRPPLPVARHGASAMAAIQGIMAKHVVFRLQDGRDIMDAQFHELIKIECNGVKRATDFAREAVVAKYLREHCTFANPDPFDRVGAYFPQREIELAVAHARKLEEAHG